nr:MAG TPA: hypothetical protein [Bacteriophage sp.]
MPSSPFICQYTSISSLLPILSSSLMISSL